MTIPTASDLKAAWKEGEDHPRFTAPFEVKQIGPGDQRTFEGMLSVWGLDLGDDVMHKGAFKNTLRDWRNSTKAMPLLNSHNHFDIMAALGQMLDAKETKEGVWSQWEVIDGPDGDGVLSRIKPSARTGRSVVGAMSIGYKALKFDFEQNDQARFGEVRNLREIALEEGSLVLFPMAPGALVDTTSVKQLIARKAATPEDLAGLRRLHDDLGSMLEAASAPDPADASLLDAPDTTKLDALRVQRLRLLARRS